MAPPKNLPPLNIAPSMSRTEKLKQDLKLLEKDPPWRTAKGNANVASFMRQGKLCLLEGKKQKWREYTFVLRDSVLFAYQGLGSNKFSFAAPKTAIYVGNSEVTRMESEDEQQEEESYSFSIVTETDDTYIFSAESDDLVSEWLSDLNVARRLTHSTIIKLAVENKCLLEEKGVTIAVSGMEGVLTNPDYILNTSLAGGIEGWATTTGFNGKLPGKAEKGTSRKCFFTIRDSHLLMFFEGDTMVKPRGMMYLDGAQLKTVADDEEEEEEDSDKDKDSDSDDESDSTFNSLDFRPTTFTLTSKVSGDWIEMTVSNKETAMSWQQAVLVASRITKPFLEMLDGQRRLLAAAVLTPRQQPQKKKKGKKKKKAVEVEEEESDQMPSVFEEHTDIQGKAMAPGAVQPHNADGLPILRDAAGNLVDPATGQAVEPTTPRFSRHGEELDPFNRPLPEGATPMFDEFGRPVGVGPDGKHYTPDGEEYAKEQTHFDAEGKPLPEDAVAAADQVAPTISLALKVQASLKPEGSKGSVTDPLGRPVLEGHSDDVVVIDGQQAPVSARRVEKNGVLIPYEEATAEVKEDTPSDLPILVDTLAKGVVEVGVVTLEGNNTTLSDVRATMQGIPAVQGRDFVFLVNKTALSRAEESSRVGYGFVPKGVEIRWAGGGGGGAGLGDEDDNDEDNEQNDDSDVGKKFTAKVQKMVVEQKRKEEEEKEFANILAKVRSRTFLNPVGRDLSK